MSIDDLLPCAEEEVELIEKEPLKKLATQTMQRVPSYQYQERLQKWMEFQVEAFLEQLACITAFYLADSVEVINITESGDGSSTLPVLQVRAKTLIPRGHLKLYP